MSYKVDKLMSEYSNLSQAEQKEFDKRYRDNKQFVRTLKQIVKTLDESSKK